MSTGERESWLNFASEAMSTMDDDNDGAAAESRAFARRISQQYSTETDEQSPFFLPTITSGGRMSPVSGNDDESIVTMSNAGDDEASVVSKSGMGGAAGGSEQMSPSTLNRRSSDATKHQELFRRLSNPTSTASTSTSSVARERPDASGAAGKQIVLEHATLGKLVKLMANPEVFDTNFVQDMLLTYRYFSTSIELFELLVQRFHAESENPEKTRVIQLRVVNVLKKWITSHFYDFKEDAALRQRVEEFITSRQSVTDTSATMVTVIKSLDGLMKKKLLVLEGDADTDAETDGLSLPQLSFLDLNPTDIAEQLTLIEMRLFKRVTPSSLTGQSWLNSESKDTTRVLPLRRLIGHFNDVSYWVASEIVLTPNLKQRAEVLKRCIQIAKILKHEQNYSTCLQFVAAVNLTCIRRLKRTWKLVPGKYLAILEDLNVLMDTARGYANYRQRISVEEPPLVPYVGIHLNDLVLIEEGNKTLCEDGLINFNKMSMIAGVIRELQWYQTSLYAYEVDSELQAWLLRGVTRLDVDGLYKRSLLCEPREGMSSPNASPAITLTPDDNIGTAESSPDRSPNTVKRSRSIKDKFSAWSSAKVGSRRRKTDSPDGTVSGECSPVPQGSPAQAEAGKRVSRHVEQRQVLTSSALLAARRPASMAEPMFASAPNLQPQQRSASMSEPTVLPHQADVALTQMKGSPLAARANNARAMTSPEFLSNGTNDSTASVDSNSSIATTPLAAAPALSTASLVVDTSMCNAAQSLLAPNFSAIVSRVGALMAELESAKQIAARHAEENQALKSECETLRQEIASLRASPVALADGTSAV